MKAAELFTAQLAVLSNDESDICQQCFLYYYYFFRIMNIFTV